MIVTLLVVFALVGGAAAQDCYWVAARFSRALIRVDSCGQVVDTVAMPTYVRSAHTAPDGKVWVVRFDMPEFDVYDPATGAVLTLPFAFGNPFDIVFDDVGDAWVSGGNGVQRFSPAGGALQAIGLAAPNAFGITMDSLGNKWIAHRNGPPGSLTRIDTAGAITSVLMPPRSTVQPTRCIADFRGIGQGSHIWIIGDYGPELLEYDPGTGAFRVFTYTGTFGSIATTRNGDLWLGDFVSGAILRVDNTGALVASFSSPPSCNGLAIDHFGELWSTSWVTFAGPQPCELRRIDGTTGNLEVVAPVGIGTQSAMSTGYHYAMVIAPYGDLDGDGDPNIGEILNGTSPWDPQSTAAISLTTTGTTTRAGVAVAGGAVSLDVTVSPGTFWTVALATGAVPAGSGLRVPGIGGEILLDRTALLAQTLAGVGPAAVVLPIPNDPNLVGFVAYFQALAIGTTPPRFSNVACVNVWM